MALRLSFEYYVTVELDRKKTQDTLEERHRKNITG